MFGNYVSIRGKHLDAYSYSSGGGMTGGYYRKSVTGYENRALISIESAEWYDKDPDVAEYYTDVAVLDELEQVVRKHRMNFWNRKKFTNIFVHDGESMSYHFNFNDANISFSSQIYPIRYEKKLAMLDNVVEKYIKLGERLPGLVNPIVEEEQDPFKEGKLIVYVSSYARNILGIKVLNGKDEPFEIPKTYKLINAKTGEIIIEADTLRSGRVSELSRENFDIRLKDRLSEGNYKIIFGDIEVKFEMLVYA